MKNILAFVFLLQSFFASSQWNKILIDTTSSFECKEKLYNEYKKKYEIINKNIFYSNSTESKIITEIFNESQNDFLQKIKNNNFICSSAVNKYLESLFSEILTKNNINSTDYKIFLSRDIEANAYNAGDGIVAINYGLFLTLENEDELVFVISHEISHQFLNHVKSNIEKFARLSTSKDIIIKTKEIQKQKYGKAIKSNNLLKNITYQNYKLRRQKEIEADSLGLIFYKKTLRNPKAAITILNKLDSVDDEKDSLTVADYKSIFEQNDFKIKERHFEQEESLFKQYD